MKFLSLIIFSVLLASTKISLSTPPKELPHPSKTILEAAVQREELTPLQAAVFSGDITLTKTLLNNGEDPTVLHMGNSLLQTASQKGDLPMVHLLLTTRIDVNACRKFFLSPLQSAVQAGHLDVVKVLIEKAKANHLVRTLEGETLLHLAANEGHLDVLAYLVSIEGLNPDSRNDEEQTPLQSFLAKIKPLLELGECDTKNIEEISFAIALILTKAGASLDLQDKDGNTSLHLASFAILEDTISFLVFCGAKTNIPNKEGLTALNLGQEKTSSSGTLKRLAKNGPCLDCFSDHKPCPVHYEHPKSGKSFLSEATKRGKKNFVRGLLRIGAVLK